MFFCVGITRIVYDILLVTNDSTKYLNVKNLLKVEVADITVMTESVTEYFVSMINSVRGAQEKQLIKIVYKSVGNAHDVESRILRDIYTKDFIIELYYQKSDCGKKIVAAGFDNRLFWQAHIGKNMAGSTSFIAWFDKLQKQLNAMSPDKYASKSIAYSEGQLQVLRSFAPITIVLNRENANALREFIRDTRVNGFVPYEVEENLQRFSEDAYYADYTADLTEDEWPTMYALYMWSKYRLQMFFVTYVPVIVLSFIFTIFLLFGGLLAIYMMRKDFWYLLHSECLNYGLTIDMKLLCSLSFTYWKMIVKPPPENVMRLTIQKMCEKMKENLDRKRMCADANRAWRSIMEYDISESMRGTLRHYYDCVVDPTFHLDRAWRNLNLLESKLLSIRNRQKMQEHQCSIDATATSETPKYKKAHGKDRELAMEAQRLLPADCDIDLASWSNTNILCLMRALMALPDIHPEAVDRLLNRQDLQNLMMRRNPFMNAIETVNKKLFLIG